MIPGFLWPYWPWLRKLWWLMPLTVFAGFAATYRVQRDHAREAVVRLEAAQAAAEATYRAQAAEAARITEAVEAGYAAELERLRAAARGRVPVVRVQIPAAPEVPRLGTAAPGDGSSGAAGGQLPGVPGRDPAYGPDVGPALYWLADDADRRVAQLRHLLERNRRLSQMASEAQP